MQTRERESRLFISAAINNIEINYRLKLSIINHFIFIIVDFGRILLCCALVLACFRLHASCYMMSGDSGFFFVRKKTTQQCKCKRERKKWTFTNRKSLLSSTNKIVNKVHHFKLYPLLNGNIHDLTSINDYGESLTIQWRIEIIDRRSI